MKQFFIWGVDLCDSYKVTAASWDTLSLNVIGDISPSGENFCVRGEFPNDEFYRDRFTLDGNFGIESWLSFPMRTHSQILDSTKFGAPYYITENEVRSAITDKTNIVTKFYVEPVSSPNARTGKFTYYLEHSKSSTILTGFELEMPKDIFEEWRDNIMIYAAQISDKAHS